MWRLQCLKEGRYPSNRRDGTPCAKSDRKRSELKRALPGKGILCEARGDWDWLNSWFNLPTWNTGSGMRWLCKAKYCDFKGQSAECRNAGLGKAGFLARVRAMGKQVCPLWGWPEMAPDVLILPAWLHAVDHWCRYCWSAFGGLVKEAIGCKFLRTSGKPLVRDPGLIQGIPY